MVKESDNYYILSDRKNPTKSIAMCNICVRFTWIQLIIDYVKVMTHSDINRKALLSDRLKLDFARRNDRIIQGIKEFAGTEIALNIVNELMYFCEVDYRFLRGRWKHWVILRPKGFEK